MNPLLLGIIMGVLGCAAVLALGIAWLSSKGLTITVTHGDAP